MSDDIETCIPSHEEEERMPTMGIPFSDVEARALHKIACWEHRTDEQQIAYFVAEAMRVWAEAHESEIMGGTKARPQMLVETLGQGDVAPHSEGPEGARRAKRR